MVGCVIIMLLQIVCRVRQWKNFENRSIIGEDMDPVLTLVYCICDIDSNWRQVEFVEYK